MKPTKHGAWNRYSSVDAGSAWQENQSNQPSRRLKNRGKPYAVENPPTPHLNEDRPLIDPIPPDKDMPRM
jgi:hypothetical protein